MQKQLILYVPKLLGFINQGHSSPQLHLPELETVLAKSRSREIKARSIEGQLFQRFGVDIEHNRLPVAAVTRLVDLVQDSSNSYWFRADPVNLVPDRDRVVMMGNRHLKVSVDEATQLAEAFNQLFAEDGIKLDAGVPHRWYLRLNSDPQIETTMLTELFGQDIHPHLPRGPNRMYWHKLLNEVQMLFYSHPVNESRRRSGLPEINSIWLWGCGCLPQPRQTGPDVVWSNELISCGLAKLGNTSLHTLPPTANEWREQARDSGQHLVVIESLLMAYRDNDLAAWQSHLEEFNQSWLVPLVAMLRKGVIDQLVLDDGDKEYQLTAKSLRHWWKRRRPLSAMVSP